MTVDYTSDFSELTEFNPAWTEQEYAAICLKETTGTQHGVGRKFECLMNGEPWCDVITSRGTNPDLPLAAAVSLSVANQVYQEAK